MEIIKSNLTIAEKREIANINAKASQNIDEDNHSSEIVRLIRENYSLSEEIAILRKTVKKLCEKVGINYEQFNNYNASVEKSKSTVHSQDTIHE